MTTQDQIRNDPRYRPVLDSGFVGLIDAMGDDASIARAARVSYGEGTKTVREDTGLLRYLMKHDHTSPFEMVEFLFHIKMPIFLARQHVRHRTASMNEYSGRYSEMSAEFYLPEKNRMQGQDTVNNKQGSADPLSNFDATAVWETIQHANVESLHAYKDLLKPRPSSGNISLSRELARIVLPVSNYTEMYWKMDLKNLLHYIGLRMDSHAQWEIQQYAQYMAEFVKQRCPITWQAFMDYKYQSIKISRGESDLLVDAVAHSNVNECSVKASMRALVEQHGDEKTLCFHYGISPKELLEFVSKLKFRM